MAKTKKKTKKKKTTRTKQAAGKQKAKSQAGSGGELRQSGRSVAGPKAKARTASSEDERSIPVAEVMVPEPLIMLEIATVAEAAERMLETGADTIVVLNDTTAHPTGIVTFRDIVLRAVAEGRDPAMTTLSNVQSKGLVIVDPEASVHEAVTLMRQRGIRRIPVVEGRDVLGVVTLERAASAVEPQATLGAIETQA